MITCEEEARQATCTTLRHTLELICLGDVDSDWKHGHEDSSSEAHNLCDSFIARLTPPTNAQRALVLERVQQFGVLNSTLALILEVAPLAGSLTPAEIELGFKDDLAPIWWPLQRVLGALNTEIWRASDSMPSLFAETRAHYQKESLRLMETLLASKNLFERTDGVVGDILMSQRQRIILLLPHAVYIDELDQLPRPLKHRHYRTGFALVWKLRFACTVPSDPLLTPMVGFFSTTTSILLLSIRRMVETWPQEDADSLAGTTLRLTGISYEELVDQCFKAIKYPLALGTDPEQEWRLIAQTIDFDGHDNLTRVLTSHNFITESAEHARGMVSKLRDMPLSLRSLGSPTVSGFLNLILAWRPYTSRVGEGRVTSDAAKVCTEAIDSSSLFVLEAWQSIRLTFDQAQTSLRPIIDTVLNIIGLCNVAKCSGLDSLLSLKLYGQIHLIQLRSSSKPYLSDSTKDQWLQLDSLAYPRDTLGELLLEVTRDPERICGLPGCTSLKSAKLQCARCKKQYYCSSQCQKPWVLLIAWYLYRPLNTSLVTGKCTGNTVSWERIRNEPFRITSLTN
ncbi:hypothetical protein DL93DRAFT_2231846 [Clavulina sp. PMI_390]|nr:hypothetical protein DL93DRAFT_2231846 [Clavulina sp. PMI_390]